MAVNQNKITMSIAIDPAIHVELKKYSKRRGQSASSYVHDLVEKALKIDVDEEPLVYGKPVDDTISPVFLRIPVSQKGNLEGLRPWLESPADETIIPVVLKLPVSLKGDEEGLKAWLEAKVNGIVAKLS